KNRRSHRSPQGDVGDAHIFDLRTIYAENRDSHATVEHTIRNGDVLEPAIRFRSEFDAAVPIDIRHLRKSLERGVQHGTLPVTSAYHAVADGHQFRVRSVAERERTFEANGVVPRRIDGAVRNAYVAAAIHVDTVALRVNLKVVDCEIGNTGCQY